MPTWRIVDDMPRPYYLFLELRIARAAVLDERASSPPGDSLAFACTTAGCEGSEEGSGFQRAIRTAMFAAADLQEEPTKRIENKADSAVQSFRRIRRRRRLPSEHRSERSEPLDTACAAERSNQISGAPLSLNCERAASPLGTPMAPRRKWSTMTMLNRFRAAVYDHFRARADPRRDVRAADVRRAAYG
jgi:hypothetical protein